MKVILTVGTVKRDLQTGQTLGDWVFIVSANGAQVDRKDLPSSTAEFDLPPGDYSATAQRFDTTGAAFGGVASVTFTIAPAAPVVAEQGDAADSLTFTLS